MFCACDEMQLLPVVFCVVIALYKYDSKLVRIETPNKWRTVERRSCKERDAHFLRRSINFTLTVVASVKGLHPCSEGQLHSLE